MRLLALLLLMASALALPLVVAEITCTINQTSTCGSATKYLGLENDTGGYENAHLQNHTLGTYANSLCCTTTTSTMDRDCSDEVLMNLSAEDNAHAQNSSIGTYPVGICMGLADSDITCRTTSDSCNANESCMLSMSDTDDAHVGACGSYTYSLCCRVLNNPPSVPVLLLPANGNNTVFDRYTLFDWQNSTDPEGDPITYEINITAPGGCAAIPNRNVTPSQYTSIEELCVDSAYNWTVRACDDKEACSGWASSWNFSIASVIDITFTSNSTQFGQLGASTSDINVSDDTLDDSPNPLVIQNDGNVDINLDAKALEALWENQGLNTSYFQYAEENQSSWIDMPSDYLNFTDGLEWSADTEIELRVQVPQFEPPGAKGSTVQALAESAE